LSAPENPKIYAEKENTASQFTLHFHPHAYLVHASSGPLKTSNNNCLISLESSLFQNGNNEFQVKKEEKSGQSQN
jgi:hypothetical protein